MTSILITFEEYTSFIGLEWKSAKAHGKNTFISFYEKNDYAKVKELKKVEPELYNKLILFIELATSCANMLPVPKYFNTGRSGPFAKWDYWDLTLIQIKKWFDAREKQNQNQQKDALRMLFAHSTHNYTFSLRSTNMFDSIKYAEQWLNDFLSWDDFIEKLVLDSFVDKESRNPIMFWDGHCFELPLPTDTEYDFNDERRNEKIKSNFKQFFETVIYMLQKRAEKLGSNNEGIFDVKVGGIMFREKMYYLPQDDWGPGEYATLWAYLNRMFNYEEKRKDEIMSLDLSRMSTDTKLILHCILKYYKKIDKYEHLTELKDMPPREEVLVISESPVRIFKEFEEMNLIL